MSSEKCLIGIDVGTSVIKAVAFDQAGRELCSHEVAMPLLQTHALWVEQDMNQMWQRVRISLGKVVSALAKLKRSPDAIGVTSTGDGTFLMTRRGEPVRPGMLWCDGRAAKVVERWHATKVASEAFSICGTSIFTGSQAAQLAWLRENEPAALRRADVIFHAKDWLFFKLTGVVSTDDTDASLTMLRMSTRAYDPKLFKIFGLTDQFEKFPAVKPCVENVAPVLPKLAKNLGLPRNIVVGSGPMDVAACALGSGAIEHGQASTILGTAGIHQVILDRPILEPHLVGMTLCHGVKGRWLRMLAAMTATPNLEWFLREMGGDVAAGASGKQLYARLDRAVKKIPTGSDGVIFHPYLFPGGERGPFVKPTARASFTGMCLEHTRSHLLRAVYEGVAFATLDCYRHMPIDPKTILLSGGGANSPVWCQIISDCLGKPVSVPAGSQFGAKGAAINIGIATGVYRDARDAVKQSVQTSRSYTPDRASTKRYHQLYRVYRQLAERQMDLWDEKARILK